MTPDFLPFAHREPLNQEGVGAATWTPGIRLPPGSWFQFCATSGPAAIRYNYGSGTTTALLQNVAGGQLSIVNVHPGPNVYVQVQAAAGVHVLFFVVP